ncbi:ROK family transcriptional regulator [Paeniglutamicibacter antarcticus]
MTSTRTTPRTMARMTRGSIQLPSHGRAHNLSLVLQTLHSSGPMSRADLSRTLGLTRVTVSGLVAELLERSHVIELGHSENIRPGKPAIMVDLNRHGLQIVGLDLAENSVLKAAVMDLDGNILHRVESLVGEEKGEEVTALVLDLATRAVDLATAPLLGIGVGTPGIVDADGMVLTAPNLHWQDVALRELIQEHTRLPTLVSNDADAAVLGEFTFGGRSDDMILVKIGRGVGSGLMVDGRRTRGVHFAAGEIGHVVVGTDGGAKCKCGKFGCLETWLSVPFVERGLAAAAASPDPEAAAKDVLRTAGERLAVALAPIVGALDLAEVVLSGPAHILEDTLLTSVKETLAQRMLPYRPPLIEIRLAKEPQDVVLRGTAVMVLWNQLGVA